VVGQQSSADPPTPVGAAGTLVNLADGIGHDEPADLSVGYWPSVVVLQRGSR
jgi:hypothetical protein